MKASLTCAGPSSLSPGTATGLCVCPEPRRLICVGISPERAGRIHSGVRLNRHVLSVVGAPSGSVRLRFEGAEHPAGLSIIHQPLRPVRPVGPSTRTGDASLKVGIGAPWLPIDPPLDADQRTVLQDALQLFHGVSRYTCLTIRHPRLRSSFSGPVFSVFSPLDRRLSCSGLIYLVRAPVGPWADGNNRRAVRRDAEARRGVDDTRTSSFTLCRWHIPPGHPNSPPAVQAHSCAIDLVFASALSLLDDQGLPATQPDSMWTKEQKLNWASTPHSLSLSERWGWSYLWIFWVVHVKIVH